MRIPVFALFCWCVSASAPVTSAEEVRGIVISCQTWGYEWGTDEMVEAMAQVKALGANWVQIHPYLSVDRASGKIDLRRVADTDEVPIWLSRPIAEAHRLGLKICIAPHLAPWRSGWRWRGEVGFEDAQSWANFFGTYETAISRLARVCAGADAFVVGSELNRTIAGHEREWRKIIAAVRRETTAFLTYGANWDDYARIPFWDALDAIGMSAYFPMVNHDGPPTGAELDRSWDRLRVGLDSFAAKQGRPVVFMELGYDQGLGAAREPWVDGDGAPGGTLVQALCLDRALAALDRDEKIAGAFLWKWFPGHYHRENYELQAPHMREVIARWWAPPSQP